MAKRSMVRVVAFDLDDTIWSTAAVIGTAVGKWYEYLEVHAPELTAKFSKDDLAQKSAELHAQCPELRHDLTKTRKLTTRQACEEANVDPDDIVEPAFAEFARWRSTVDAHIFPDVLGVLDSLSCQGLVLCAITNGNAQIDLTCLKDRMAFCVRAEDVGAKKPDPAPFLRALELASCSPEEMLYIGDNWVDDVEGPQALGIRAIWINRKQKEPPDASTATPSATLTSLQDLPALITSWNQEALSVKL